MVCPLPVASYRFSRISVCVHLGSMRLAQKPLAAAVFALLLAVGTICASARPISFTADVAPLLQRRCVACHGPDKAKGHYRLDTFANLLKPGSSDKPPVVPGQPEASQLYRLLVEKNPDDRMPQDADPLAGTEVAVTRDWIASGAKFDGASRTAPQLTNTGLSEEGIQLSQRIIGSSPGTPRATQTCWPGT